ncbi:hypothetical protein K9M09_02925, partial [Patescibacteria group bacterium]|nr:hypothetical protein [Patescibacteria group bacterium]
NSAPIKFLNQYSNKINQEAFAGRPYGCSGVGCDNIGYCSLNPNVLCLLDATDSANISLVNQKSCGAANGTCVPLWNGENIANDSDFKTVRVLKNIFNTAFAEFTLNNDAGTYINDSGVVYELNSYIPENPCSSIYNHLPSNDSVYDTYNCYIRPQITNVRIDNGLAPITNISAGIHKLTFNTMIDLEQQPLKDLTINWGDGSIQNLVNQDHRPEINSPHVVYHYYANDSTGGIKIKVTDNWNRYCCSRNGSDVCGNNPDTDCP